ncbi:MAG TPA: hypothetical protein VGF69_00030 [Thermoanaerobaculia bacterium]|jgi:hypothetical protein
MERVAFLVEQSGVRIPCMLNPESLVLRRWSGVRALRNVGGLTGTKVLNDDPLLHTGGGTTEVLVDLLFDVSLVQNPSPNPVPLNDVRLLTQPLWALSEDSDPAQPGAAVVRFVWGKTWNIRAIIAAIAERLEYFDGDGAPGRSWLRMRMLRIDDDGAGEQTIAPQAIPGAETQVVEIPPTPDSTAEEEPPQRLDEVAYRFYGNAALWKSLAAFNSIIDPFNVPAGFALRLPPIADLQQEPR